MAWLTKEMEKKGVNKFGSLAVDDQKTDLRDSD